MQIGEMIMRFVLLLCLVIFIGCQRPNCIVASGQLQEESGIRMLNIPIRNLFVVDLLNEFRKGGFDIRHNSKGEHLFIAISNESIKGFLDIDFSKYTDYPDSGDFRPANTIIRTEFEPTKRCQYLNFEKETEHISDLIGKCADKYKNAK
jgi:hypothetical protein